VYPKVSGMAAYDPYDLGCIQRKFLQFKLVVFSFRRTYRRANTPCKAVNGFKNTCNCHFIQTYLPEEESDVTYITYRQQICNCESDGSIVLKTDSMSYSSHELSITQNKRDSNIQVEQTSTSNHMEAKSQIHKRTQMCRASV